MTPTVQRTVPLLVAMLLAALPATGQIRVIPEEKLLESSSPRLSSDSSSLAFDRTKVLLDTLTEDSSPVSLEFRMTNTSKRKIALRSTRPVTTSWQEIAFTSSPTPITGLHAGIYRYPLLNKPYTTRHPPLNGLTAASSATMLNWGNA